MLNLDLIEDIFWNHKFHMGRLLSGNKTAPVGEKCIWNANIITKSHGKVWFGDVNLTRDANVLKDISKIIGETLYVLKEADARFGTENEEIESLIRKAVWNTSQQPLVGGL